MGKNYYNILEIESNATDEEIKKSYCNLALKFHPDKNKSPQAEKRFKEIAEAYEILSDKYKRKMFDQYGEVRIKEEMAEPDGDNCTFQRDASETFGQFSDNTNPFCGFVNTNDPTQHMPMWSGAANNNSCFFGEPSDSECYDRKPLLQNPPIEMNLYLSLEEINEGCDKYIEVMRSIFVNDQECKEKKILKVCVPPGVAAGIKLILPEVGDRTPGKIPADLVLIVQDIPHSLFRRERSDIYYTAPITLKQALCGTEIQVPTLNNEIFKFNTYAEIIKYDSVKRFIGRGLPRLEDNSQRGDLVVSFNIYFPEELQEANKILVDVALP